MRTKTMRNVLLWITGVFLFVFLAGIYVGQPIQKRSARAAEVEIWKTGVFEMNDGVSLRFSDENGLRFIVKMDEDIRLCDTCNQSFFAYKTLMLRKVS